VVIQFDIPASVIPSNAVITKATLSLYAHAKYKSNWNNDKKYVYQITESWDESTVTYRNKPSYNNQSIASNDNTSTGVWESYDVTEAIKDIVENNAYNYGFLVKLQERSYRGVKFRSSESGEITERPKLTITYETTDTEEPVVKVKTPNGGEVWQEGATKNITWEATDNAAVVSASLYYSADAGASWTMIGDISGNPGSYTWTVPNDVSTSCKIKVEAEDAAGNKGSDESDSEFTISPMTGINTNSYKILPHANYTITVINVQGREITTFTSNTIGNINRKLSSGVHIIHISTPGEKIVKKYSLIK